MLSNLVVFVFAREDGETIKMNGVRLGAGKSVEDFDCNCRRFRRWCPVSLLMHLDLLHTSI